MAETNALMGMAHVLKPFWRFEYWYDRTTAPALRGSVPIALFPTSPNIPAATDPPGVDRRAYDEAVVNGETGYAANLASMLPMPQIGSDVLVWLPQIRGQGGEQDTDNCYIYVPVWRMRTVRDQIRYQKQAHVPKESFGAPNTGFVPPQDRYILPAAMGPVVISKQEFEANSEGTLPGYLQPACMLREGIAMPASSGHDIDEMPYAPDGTRLAYEQGVLDGLVFGTQPNFKPYWLKVMGDELGFWVYKARYPQSTDNVLTFTDWDFRYDPVTGYCDGAAGDVYFSQFFGVGTLAKAGLDGLHPDTGLYVMAGVTSG